MYILIQHTFVCLSLEEVASSHTRGRKGSEPRERERERERERGDKVKIAQTCSQFPPNQGRRAASSPEKAGPASGASGCPRQRLSVRTRQLHPSRPSRRSHDRRESQESGGYSSESPSGDFPIPEVRNDPLSHILSDSEALSLTSTLSLHFDMFLMEMRRPELCRDSFAVPPSP